MSHFGRSGPPDIKDSYSLLVLNITFRTTANDLYPLFDRYGKVVDIFIPRDRRTGDSRGFAFVRYKYADEAEKAIERLDGRNVDGRDIVVQFAKYGPNAEIIHKGRLTAEPPHWRGRYSRSRSPRRSSRKYHDDYRGRDYRRRSRSHDRYERYKYHEREREYHRRSYSSSPSSHSRSHSRIRMNDEPRKRYRSQSRDSSSPVRRSASPLRRSPPARSRSPDGSSPSLARSPVAAGLSPNAGSQLSKRGSMSPSNSG